MCGLIARLINALIMSRRARITREVGLPAFRVPVCRSRHSRSSKLLRESRMSRSRLILKQPLEPTDAPNILIGRAVLDYSEDFICRLFLAWRYTRRSKALVRVLPRLRRDRCDVRFRAAMGAARLCLLRFFSFLFAPNSSFPSCSRIELTSIDYPHPGFLSGNPGLARQ